MTNIGCGPGETIEQTRSDAPCLVGWRDRDRQLRERAALRVSRRNVGQNPTPRRAKTLAVVPRDPASAHRRWTQTPQALDEALARQEERVLSKALTFSAEGTKYCVRTAGVGIAMRGARVTLRHFLDGALQVSYKGKILTCTAFRRLPRPSPAEDEKTLDTRVEAVIAANALKNSSARTAKPRGHG